MDFFVILLWCLRIVLPMVLFYLYLKYHQKSRTWENDPGYKGPYKYDKLHLLAHRRIVDKEAVPEAVADLQMGMRHEFPDGLDEAREMRRKKRDTGKHRFGIRTEEEKAEKEERRAARREQKEERRVALNDRNLRR